MKRIDYNPYQESLPIVDALDELKSSLSNFNTTVLSAPPGAGKSTIVPLALANENWLNDKKILVLEPRRLAAKGIASRMSNLLNEKVGESVGYRIRFDTKISEDTLIEILTEGILTRILQQDNALEEVGMVIFDEFHERSIHADTALAFVREIQETIRPDLRILIMSATLDTNFLADRLNCPIVESNGKQYPVEVFYEGDSDEKFTAEAVASCVKKVHELHDGDILCFLPGEREIKLAAEIISKYLKSKGTVIHMLYGRLPQAKQQAAILPNKDKKRKVVLATSIAETSLTIEGVSIVIDSGFIRNSKYDPRSALSALVTERITIDAADQRAGRAGRLGPGFCYRLWSKGTHSKLNTQRKPELLEADLTNLTLNLYNWGVSSYEEMMWIDLPPAHSIKRSTKLLSDLNAIEKDKITPHGKLMLQFPSHPRIAHMLLMAEDQNLTDLATDIAAIIEERDPLNYEDGIDISLRIEALRRFRKNKGSGGKFGKIERIAQQYRKLMELGPVNDVFDPFEAGLLLVHAFPERIAFARPGNNAQFQLANGSYARASHKDDLAHEPWLAIANLNDNPGGIGKIFLAAPLNPKDLMPFVRTIEVIEWNTKKGGLLTQLETRIGNIVLKSTPLTDLDPELIASTIIEAIEKEGHHLLDFNEDVTNWLNKLKSIKIWHPEIEIPIPTIENARDWLSPYLADIRKVEDLKKLNLLEILQHSLPFELTQTINALAPDRIKVPSGANIKLNYQLNGNPPILAVRLQEIFGLFKTPLIDNGNIKVLMHILSPGYKLVQTTDDLESFWSSTYFEIRKELRIRYKKHAWPENPLNYKP